MDVSEIVASWKSTDGAQALLRLLQESGIQYEQCDFEAEAASAMFTSEAIICEGDEISESADPIAKKINERYTLVEKASKLNIPAHRNETYEGIEQAGKKPMYVIFEMPSGFSKVLDEETIRHPDKSPTKATRNRYWPEEVIHDFAEQIRSRRPVGYMGHANMFDFGTIPDNIPVQWETAIKARRKSDGVGVTLARGYVYDHGMNRAYLETGAISSASVATVGRTEQDTTDKNNPYPVVKSAGLISFDFVRKDTHGIPGTRLVANISIPPSQEAANMQQLTAEQIALIVGLTAEQLKQFNPTLFMELAKVTPDADFTALAEQLKAEIIKGVNLSRDASVAQQCSEEMGCKVSDLVEVCSNLRKRGDALVESAIVAETESIVSEALRKRVRDDLRNLKISDPAAVKGKMAESLQSYRDFIAEIAEGLDLTSVGTLVTENAKTGGNSLLADEWR